jgi:hypothetical protein
MNMLGYQFEDELFKLIEPDSLEKKFGGTLPTKDDNFFPPDVK